MPATQEVKKQPSTLNDFFLTDQSTWEWVTIPSKDVLGKNAPTFSLNNREFSPGERYLVPPQVAKELHERIDVWNEYTARLLQDTLDYKALRAVARGTQ